MRNLVASNPFLSLADIKRNLSLPIDPRTIRNYLNELGFNW